MKHWTSLFLKNRLILHHKEGKLRSTTAKHDSPYKHDIEQYGICQSCQF
ncbi:hypothetical protein NIES2104_60900 [Leptolyngbya sp. NIES-2104]|nr:hypothetical protein NIES2104_60900 [Leptolyngbya sp. NIES-2104]